MGRPPGRPRKSDEHKQHVRAAATERRKIRYRAIIIAALSEPAAKWLNRKAMATLLGVKNIMVTFTSQELDEIESEALENRKKALADIRKGYMDDLLEIDQTVLKKAKCGSLGHAHLAYDRFEGPVASKMEVTGSGGAPLAITSFPPTPDSLAEWEKMIKNDSRPKPEDGNE